MILVQEWSHLSLVRLASLCVMYSITHCLEVSSHSKLKIAKVTPIYKCDDCSEISKYRPISVLPCLSKILEKIVYDRIVNFFNKLNLICNSQYGFRSNHSTSTALIDLTSKIIGAFENNAYAM